MESVKMKNFNIIGVHWKIRVLVGGIHERPVYRTELPIKGGGGLDNLQIQRGRGC